MRRTTALQYAGIAALLVLLVWSTSRLLRPQDTLHNHSRGYRQPSLPGYPHMPYILTVQAPFLLYNNPPSETYSIKHARKPICPDLKSHRGVWSTRRVPVNLITGANGGQGIREKEMAWWEPETCQYHTFSPTDIRQCLAGKTFVFSGDSILRNILREIVQQFDAWFVWTDKLGQADQDIALDTEFGHTRLRFLWEPSVYQSAPRWSFGNNDEENQIDHVVMNFGVWDMGQYNLGVNAFFQKLTSVLTTICQDLHTVITQSRRPKAILLRTHRIHESECKTSAPLCAHCNTPIRQAWFREAQRAALACMSEWMHMDSSQCIDPMDVFHSTNTSFAQAHSVDGVHYDSVVAFMETQILLQGLCRDWMTTSGLFIPRVDRVNRQEDVAEGDTCSQFENVDRGQVAGQCELWDQMQP